MSNSNAIEPLFRLEARAKQEHRMPKYSARIEIAALGDESAIDSLFGTPGSSLEFDRRECEFRKFLSCLPPYTSLRKACELFETKQQSQTKEAD